MEKPRRRNWVKSPLIEHQSQLYLSFVVVLYLLLYSAVLIVIILLPSVLRFTSDSIPLDQQLQASKEFLLLDMRVIPAIVTIVFIMSFNFLYITHRIFGPLNRLKRVFGAWQNGMWPRTFSLRKKDFHQDLFLSFNTAADRIGNDLTNTRDHLIATLDSIKETTPDSMSHESQERLKIAELSTRRALSILEKYSMGGQNDSPSVES